MPMPKNKAEWIALLTEMGEAVTDEWTIIQMKARYAEIKPEVEVMETLETQLKAMRQAARKKPELVHFMETLGMEANKNDTIAELVSKTEKHLHASHEPVGTDKLNFGQHAQLTYQEVIEQKGSYLKWCRKTAAEGDANWRLLRLVRFADQVRHAEKFKSQGYGKKHDETAPSSVTSFSVVTHTPEDAAQMKILQQEEELAKLQAQLKEIQAEKDELELKDARNKLRKET